MQGGLGGRGGAAGVTFVCVLRGRGRESYELRRDPSRCGKPLTRDEAEELIALPGTSRVRRIAFDDCLNEIYELGRHPA